MNREYSVIEAKRGPAIWSMVPAPRRRSDQEAAKWPHDVNNLDDEYDGKYMADTIRSQVYFSDE